jgi:MFS family permease
LGCSATTIGLNTSIYYLGIAAAAGLIPWFMRHFRRQSLVIGMVASGVTVSVFPWAGSFSNSPSLTLPALFLFRLLNGFAGALSLIPMETLVNRNSPQQKRAADFGYYAFSMALGIALGTAVGMQMYRGSPHAGFVAGGASALLAGIIILGWLEWLELPSDAPNKTPFALAHNVLSFGSAWSQGFLEGGMVGLLPVYLVAIAFSEAGVGWLMAGIMVGVILFQVPVAWLADKFGRTMVLLGCQAVTVVALVALYRGQGTFGLSICLFLAGACSSSFYPLGLAVLGERVPASGFAGASAWFLGINCFGSLMGPAAAGAAMDIWGKQAIFLSGLAAVLVVVLAWIVLHFYEIPRRAVSLHKSGLVLDDSPESRASVEEQKAA